MTRPDLRIVDLVNRMDGMGAPVEAAMVEAALRSMGGSPFASALRSVCDDFAQGVWPVSLTAETEVVGESWERCVICDDDFLPAHPDDTLCPECSVAEMLGE